MFEGFVDKPCEKILFELSVSFASAVRRNNFQAAKKKHDFIRDWKP